MSPSPPNALLRLFPSPPVPHMTRLTSWDGTMEQLVPHHPHHILLHPRARRPTTILGSYLPIAPSTMAPFTSSISLLSAIQRMFRRLGSFSVCRTLSSETSQGSPVPVKRELCHRKLTSSLFTTVSIASSTSKFYCLFCHALR